MTAASIGYSIVLASRLAPQPALGRSRVAAPENLYSALLGAVVRRAPVQGAIEINCDRVEIFRKLQTRGPHEKPARHRVPLKNRTESIACDFF